METCDHRAPRRAPRPKPARLMSPLLWYRLHMEVLTTWWIRQDKYLRGWLLVSAALLFVLSVLILAMPPE